MSKQEEALEEDCRRKKRGLTKDCRRKSRGLTKDCRSKSREGRKREPREEERGTVESLSKREGPVEERRACRRKEERA